MYTNILRSLSGTFCICFLAIAVNAQQNPANDKPTVSSQNISGVKPPVINQGAQTSTAKTASSLSGKEAGAMTTVQNTSQNVLGKNPAVAKLPSNQTANGNPGNLSPQQNNAIAQSAGGKTAAQLPSNQPVKGTPAQQQNSLKMQSAPASLPTQDGAPKKQQ